MKPTRIWIYILVLATALAVALWFQQSRQKATPESPQTTDPFSKTTSVIALVARNSGPAVATSSNQEPVLRDDNVGAREAEWRQETASKNIPVAFYGEVIDQGSQPITGVHVVMNVRHSEYLASNGIVSTYPKLDTLTDSSGRFEWTGETGDVLGVESIAKEGYLLSSKTARNFAPSGGSAEKPAVIKMWKLGESQKLVSHSLSRIAMPVDGQPVQFDLLNGIKASSGGQLIVHFERNPQVLPPGNSRYDWTAQFEIPGGGLVANNDEFSYLAPAAGYQGNYTVKVSKSAEDWKPTLDQSFYIELESQEYFGILTVHLLTFHNPPPVVLSFDVTINSSGSRNLQP